MATTKEQMKKLRQQALQRTCGQRPGVQMRRLALVFEGHRGQPGFGDLPGETAELLDQGHVGPQTRRLLGADRGHVDGVDHGAGIEIVGHLLGHLQRHVLLRLHRRGAEMRRCDHARHAEQGIVGGRLLGVDIDRDAAGYGWFVDTTPFDDFEFSFDDATGKLQAVTGSQASGRFDLLTVVFHELGHILGFDHDETDDDSETLMSATLSAGSRRLPELTNADSLFTDDAFDQLLETLETNPLGSLV